MHSHRAITMLFKQQGMEGSRFTDCSSSNDRYCTKLSVTFASYVITFMVPSEIQCRVINKSPSLPMMLIRMTK